MDINLINDNRNINDFKTSTFSDYKKSNVKNELVKSINNKKLEESNYWCAELICSGHFLDLWNIIIQFVNKYIHIGNPKLPSYLFIRYSNFKKIIENSDDDLSLRNNSKIREIFCEIICILCFSPRRQKLEYIKLNNDDFNIENINRNIQAPSNKYIQEIFKEGDPQSLFIVLNELAFNLSRNVKNEYNCFFWIEWLFEFENKCKKNKEHLNIIPRNFINIEDKYKCDIVWVIWEIILNENKNNNFKKSILNDLLKLFCINYSYGIKKTRKYLIYHAVMLTIQDLNEQIKIYENKNHINNIIKKIDLIYQQINSKTEENNTNINDDV